jgi:hypothetical protein
MWTPGKSLIDQQYTMEIKDGSGTNYGGPFRVNGAASFSDLFALTTSTTTAVTPTATVTIAAPTKTTSDSTTSTLETPPPNKQNGLSIAAKAGIGILATILGLLIIGIALWYFRRKFLIAKRRNEEHAAVATPPELGDTSTPTKQEMDGEGVTWELENGMERHEAEAPCPRYELSEK